MYCNKAKTQDCADVYQLLSDNSLTHLHIQTKWGPLSIVCLHLLGLVCVTLPHVPSTARLRAK